MPLSPNSSRCRSQGFTLTELAVVLAVVGVILGAILVAAARVSVSNRAQRATGEIMQIVDGYRSLYAARGVDVADGTDITCLGVDSGFFPTTMIVGDCASGTYPRPAWGGDTSVKATANQTRQAVLLTLYSLDKDACNLTMNLVSGTPDIIYQRINTVSQYLPPYASNSFYTASEIATNCTSTNDNTIGMMFKAR
jgi:prepilin-type N-terminal cleavage/methylation domain-containing protein